ncbi:MAG: ABC transporter substrate-binding protein [Alphaproteobacteria bacterium]|nr:MAG: ABC transporter substrate-binding protein [Alphaproteobacteria bacterium]
MASFGKAASLALAAALSIGLATLPASAEDAPGVTPDSVKIGSWVALSGPVAVYGVPLRAGVQSYFDLVNDRGGINGRKIEWIVEDNAYNPQQTVAIARKLISSDNVLALVVPHGTGQSAAAFPYAIDQQKVPMLLPYGGAKDWYDPLKPGLLGLHVLYEDQAAAIGRWAAQDGHKKVLVIYGANAAFENVANHVEPGVKALSQDASVELLPVKIGTTDYGPIVLDIMNRKPDAIVCIQLLQEIVLLSKGLKQQGADIQVYSYAPTVGQATIDLGGEFVEGLKAPSLTNSPFSDHPAAQEYREALAKYAPGEKPDFVSYLGFGAAKIFAEALSKAQEPLTRESLLGAFHAMQGYDSGIFPPVTFAQERPLGGHLLQPMQVKDGKWVEVGDVIDVNQF